ncbi:hypothetical protein A3762_06635 [Oleiphilus sp. HI0125]|nr:hypothetical protein A3739_02625 [Oleiphilus sp. HI0067]KZZ58844.1 hypothetical protein A3762_06635 [Oleiphilus sp. HI0125]
MLNWRVAVENRIEVRKLLLAAEKVRQHGEQKSGRYFYSGLTLEMSFDGYTFVLSTPKASISVFFHNKFQANYRNNIELEELYDLACKIAKTDAA